MQLGDGSDYQLACLFTGVVSRQGKTKISLSSCVLVLQARVPHTFPLKLCLLLSPLCKLQQPK